MIRKLQFHARLLISVNMGQLDTVLLNNPTMRNCLDELCIDPQDGLTEADKQSVWDVLHANFRNLSTLNCPLFTNVSFWVTFIEYYCIEGSISLAVSSQQVLVCAFGDSLILNPKNLMFSSFVRGTNIGCPCFGATVAKPQRLYL